MSRPANIPAVLLPDDDWSIIRRAWASSILPPPGGPAWATLPDGDEVKKAAVIADRLGVRELVNAHGPSYALCVYTLRQGPTTGEVE